MRLGGCSGCLPKGLADPESKSGVLCFLSRAPCPVGCGGSEATAETYKLGTGSGDRPHLVIRSLATPPILSRPVQALVGSNRMRSGFVTRAHLATLET